MAERCELCGEIYCVCGNKESDKDKVNSLGVINITAQDLQNKIATNSSLFVINVLDKKYYEDCHIKGSINVPLNVLESVVKDWDKNREIVTYCANNKCPASSIAFQTLKNLGFKNVSVYEGGIKEWLEKGYLTEGPCLVQY